MANISASDTAPEEAWETAPTAGGPAPPADMSVDIQIDQDAAIKDVYESPSGKEAVEQLPGSASETNGALGPAAGNPKLVLNNAKDLERPAKNKDSEASVQNVSSNEVKPMSVMMETKDVESENHEKHPQVFPGNGKHNEIEAKENEFGEAMKESETGDKRKAEQQAGSKDDTDVVPGSMTEKANVFNWEPNASAHVSKKPKTHNSLHPASEEKVSRGKREKKSTPFVGRTERRTRSQGLAEV